MPSPPITGLPVETVLPELRRALAAGPAAVLEAPPGAGKTTLVPLHLLGEPWLAGRRILMLEPRRLAARAAAARMAELLGESVGHTVGYAMRFDRRIGPDTRIEVVTEGLLARYLQRDQSLEPYGAVIFDEFHERPLDADLGLALCLEVQDVLRLDLRLVVMSATLDGGAVAAHLGGAPVVRSDGRLFPVRVEHVGSDPAESLELRAARAVELALGAATGGVLVFLPGAQEIRRTMAVLAAKLSGTPVLPLYGDLPQAAQDAAIRPGAGRRVVLATNIAETSLTIDGIAAVVDSGLERRQRFSARTGMSRLVTVPIARGSAEQRAGRAGRLGPGLCLRLWSMEEERGRTPHRPAEIEEADLAPLALALAAWGVADPRRLRFLTLPPSGPFAAGRRLLGELGALADDGVITPHGRAMADLPLHPRLAHMVLMARERGLGATAIAAAACLSARDAASGGVDLARRLAEPAGSQTERIRRQLARFVGEGLAAPDPAVAGAVLSLAFPDRIARARPGSRGAFLLANGRGVRLDRAEPLAAEAWLAVAEVDDTGTDARVRLAAALRQDDILTLHASRMTTATEAVFDARTEVAIVRNTTRLGALVLHERTDEDGAERVAALLCAEIRRRGPDLLPWTAASRQLQGRIAFLRQVDPETWPDLSDAGLVADLQTWLAPHLDGLRRLGDLTTLDLAEILRSRLDLMQRRELALRAPERITLPGGRSAPIDYTIAPPTLAVRMQDVLGLATTPTVDQGRVPLTLHLLSPAQRPVAVTRDLAGFWVTGYPAVRKELRGRFTRHAWPEDPLAPPPTNRTRKPATGG